MLLETHNGMKLAKKTGPLKNRFFRSCRYYTGKIMKQNKTNSPNDLFHNPSYLYKY